MSHQKLISYSQIAAFLKCRKYWEFAYLRALAPVSITRPLRLGTLVHHYLEEVLKYDDHLNILAAHTLAVEKIKETVIEYVNNNLFTTEGDDDDYELANIAVQLGYGAFKQLKAQGFTVLKLPNKKGVDTPVIEWPVSYDVDGVKVVGTIDAVLVDSNGNAWIVDHKVRKQLQPVENEEVNLQLMVYQHMFAQQHPEVQVVGTIAFQIYSALPSIPATLKNGGISRADCRTTWEVYRQTVVKHGLNPDDYMDMAEKLKHKEFYRLSSAYRTPVELQTAWDTIVLPTIQKIVASYSALELGVDSDLHARSLSVMGCLGCQYKELCLETMRGRDISDFEGEYGHNTYLDKYNTSGFEESDDAN